MATKHSLTAKRWLVGLASVGAATVLVACGSGSSPDTAADTTGQGPIAAEGPAGEAPAVDDGTVSEGDTVVDVVASESDFSTLAEAVEAAGLTDSLATSGPITLFAPTNEAFEALPEGTLDELLLPENQDVLRQVLSYHVLQDEVSAEEATTGDVPTVAGETIALQVDDATGDVMVNEAMVVQPDIEASNGVIHGIDQVILPPGLEL